MNIWIKPGLEAWLIMVGDEQHLVHLEFVRITTSAASLHLRLAEIRAQFAVRGLNTLG